MHTSAVLPIALAAGLAAGQALAAPSDVHFVDRPGGRVSYSLAGPSDGRLAVLVPGVGDSRASYRYLEPILHEAGWRTAAISLRGLDESTTDWEDYSPSAVGSDVVALMDTLGADTVTVIGNSFGGAVAVWVAAERPEQVKSVVLLDAFVRDTGIPWYKLAMFKLALMRPWGLSAWTSVYKKAYVSHTPADLDEYTASLKAMLKEKGRWSSFMKMLWTPHHDAEARIPEVNAPVLAVMGEKDGDFDDPAEELRIQGELFGAQTVTIAGAGHYPHAEAPVETGTAITRFLKEIQ